MEGGGQFHQRMSAGSNQSAASTSAGISNPSSNPINRNMNPRLHPLIPLPCAPAAHQFHLQVVQWVDVRKAVFDGAGQGRVVREALFFAGDAREGVGGAVPFGLDAGEHLFAQAGVGDEFAVA